MENNFYSSNIFNEQSKHVCIESCASPCRILKLHICYTCHRKLLANNLPAESHRNNLSPDKLPKELEGLNSIEKHLIALNINFRKVVTLPKRGQYGISGPIICVPANISKTTDILPREDSQNQIFSVKLKRKLNYKAHYEFQYVNTEKVYSALLFLK